MGYIRAKQLIEKQKAMAARHNGRDRLSLIQLSDEYRRRIKCACLLSALAEHAMGQREMSATQVQAARILLAKVMPDISHVTLAGDASAPLQTRLTVSWEAVDVTPRVEIGANTKQIEHKSDEPSAK